MEKERIEKELAEKFSHQLHLESNKLNIFEQEDAEIDEFPGELFTGRQGALQAGRDGLDSVMGPALAGPGCP